MRAVLIGNYGTGNLGDEALLEYFLATFPDIEWTVLTAGKLSKCRLPRLPFGLRSVLRPWWWTLGAMMRCDAVVFGGGSLFSQAESWVAPLLWWWHAFIARLMGKDIVLAFQGIGPLCGGAGEWCTRWVVRRAVHISVRDAQSFKRLTRMLSPDKITKIVQTFDPVLAMIVNSKINRTKKLIIIPRCNFTREFLDRVRSEVSSDHWQQIGVVLMAPEDRCLRSRGALREILTARPDVMWLEAESLEQLAEHITGAGFVLTQRFHGAVAALALGIPFLGMPQSSGDKLDAINGASREECMLRVREGEKALRGYLFSL